MNGYVPFDLTMIVSISKYVKNNWLLVEYGSSGNLLQDHGVCIIASLIFDRSFAKMKRILLQSNDCGDIGVTAVYKAFEANPYEVCPEIDVINLRRNKVTERGLARINPCPNFLII